MKTTEIVLWRTSASFCLSGARILFLMYLQYILNLKVAFRGCDIDSC
jgi:hypothetical protein